MPRGGFGNLIALPLQHGPRALGNSVFLDDQLRPYPDDQQWFYLASLPRIDVTTVEKIAREATDRGSVTGVQIATFDEEDTAPWSRPPSRKRSPAVITEPLPRVVRAVLAQKLFVDKEGLPSPLVIQIKRLAAFQNPEFYRKQSMYWWPGVELNHRHADFQSTTRNALTRGNDGENPGRNVQYFCEIPTVKSLIPRDSTT
jgi:hypothetical protein